MKSLIILFLALSPFFNTLYAASCEIPSDLDSYRVIDGDYSLSGNWNNQRSDSDPLGIYVKGDVSIGQYSTFTGNIYATGDITIVGGTVIGSLFSEKSINFSWGSVTGESCSEIYCSNPPDISDYKVYEGDFEVQLRETLPNSGSEDIYVQGEVLLHPGATYNGNIYSTGDVELRSNQQENDTVINGNVYTVGSVIFDTNNNQHPGNPGMADNSEINGNVCENGSEIILPTVIELPVDELTGQCHDIFEDAVQSFVSGSELYMQNDTQIIDSETNEFSFSSISGDSKNAPPADSCGTDDRNRPVQCGIKSPISQSKQLSNFTIPTIEGEDIYSWNSSQQYITLGGTGNSRDIKYYNATTFGQITAGKSSVMTFLAQDYAVDEMYQIDRLIVQDTSTVKLSSGVYAIREFKLDRNATIEIIGDGDVFMFIDKGVYTDELSLQGTITSSAENKLYFITNNKTTFNTLTSVTAALYVNGDMTLSNEMQIYGQVAAHNLTMERGTRIENDLRCGTFPVDDQYELEIITSADALTCEPHALQVNVVNEGDDTQYTEEITLTSDSVTSTWSLTEGGGTLSNTINGEATYQFVAGDQGSATFALSEATAGELIVTINGGGLEATSKQITFHSSLIKVDFSCIETINGTCINTANRPFDLQLTALKTEEESMLCESYDPVGIKFWSDYISPNSGTEMVAINSGEIGRNEQTASQLALEFSSGMATVTVNYPDAGKVAINVSDASNATIQGSAETIINPFKLVIDDITEHVRNITSGRVESPTGFIRASVPDYDDLQVDTFDITVKAIIDCSSTGEPTNCPSIGDDVYSIAANFDTDIDLLSSRIGNYALGALAYKNALAVSLTGGAFTYEDLAYSEVGELGLQIENKDYLVTDNHVPVDEILEIGHFYPDYLAWGDYNLENTCNDFSYLGQQSAKLSYALRAYNQAFNPSVTTNYDTELGYPTAPTENFNHYAFAGSTELTTRLLLDDYYQEKNWYAGSYLVTQQQVGIERIENTPDGPYLVGANAAEYWVELEGGDGEKLKVDSETDCATDRCVLGDLGDLIYGRLELGNGHGSEYQSLRTLAQTTYFNGSDFVPFQRDNCTSIVNGQFSATPAMNIKNEIAVGSNAATTLSMLNDTLISGKGYLQFSAPNERGELDYFMRLTDSSDNSFYAPWLLDSSNAVACPDASNGLDECISGHVQFGLFRSNDRVIYRKQTFN